MSTNWDDGYDVGLKDGRAEEAHIVKSKAIELLEGRIAELEFQITALQTHNTELLLRARKAEDDCRRWESNSRPG